MKLGEMPMRPINLMAPVNNLGYGVVGYNFLKGLVLAHQIVCFFPIGNVDYEGDNQLRDIVKGTTQNAQFPDFNAPSLKIWHQHDMALFPGRGKRIGFPIFELNRFTDQEKNQLRSLDQIIVCSEWAKQVIKDNDINVPVSVVPLGVEKGIFNINQRIKKNRPYWLQDTTIFMNVGKWEVRKGHNELLEAFCKAFTPEDKVELWMMNENPFIGIENEVWKQKYIESPMGSKIRIKHRASTQHELAELFNQIDVGVFPSHAEGWNLEPLEMMACGANIIATNYSGHTEYLNTENALLVNPIGLESAQDGKWFHGQGDWCKFSVDDLADAMRFAHESKQKGVGQSPTCQETVEKFTWQNAVNKLIGAIGA
jgi:glycosyltransferase involved in cell wall biosynthesis